MKTKAFHQPKLISCPSSTYYSAMWFNYDQVSRILKENQNQGDSQHHEFDHTLTELESRESLLSQRKSNFIIMKMYPGHLISTKPSELSTSSKHSYNMHITT